MAARAATGRELHSLHHCSNSYLLLEETLVPDKLLLPVPYAVRLCMIELAVPLVQL
jgi:hypothetical protein